MSEAQKPNVKFLVKKLISLITKHFEKLYTLFKKHYEQDINKSLVKIERKLQMVGEKKFSSYEGITTNSALLKQGT